MDIVKIKSELKSRVAKGLNFGMEAVEELLPPNDALFNEFILLKSKYNDLMHISSINTLPYDQIELGLDKLRNNLLRIIDQLEPGTLQKEGVKTDFNLQDLSTRRTNFFKLLDIHFKNLDALRYIEIINSIAGEEKTKSGREAIFEWYRMDKRRLHQEKNTDKVIAFFKDKFSFDIGPFEVYFKNIKHMLSYILQNEIEQQFFLDTLQSLLSKYELAYIFYYAISDIDTEFKAAVKKSELISSEVKAVLINKNHLALL